MSETHPIRLAISSKLFKRIFTILSVLFIILTFFISLTPDSFLQFGYLGIFGFNVISSGLLIMPLITEKFNLPAVIVISAFGNIFNTSVSYLVGTSSNSMFSKFEFVDKVKKFMRRYETLGIYILSILPLPVDANGLLSGYLGINYRKYIFINFLGKVTLFLLVGLGIITITKIQD